MKAAIIRQHGGPEVMACEEVVAPEPKAGEVKVRLYAAALNRLDLWVREGWAGLHLAFPHILGSDGAGEIAAVGEGVTEFQPGDRVVLFANISCGKCSFCLSGRQNMCSKWQLLGETRNGTYAEYIVVPAGNLLRLPEKISYRAAAASSLVFLTAWHSLITRGQLQPGETVLIVGASGGVNTASMQIARLMGAKIYVLGSSAAKLKLAQSLGADVTIDRSRRENWAETVYQATDRMGVDVVVDNVGAGTMAQSMRAVKKGGRILTVGNTAGAKFEIDNRYIFGKHLSILGSTAGTPADFRKVMQFVIDGKLQPVLDRDYPLAEVRQAMARLESGQQMGKITLAL